MKVEIDPLSGFCAGVVKAIEKAENELRNASSLYCLGDIVHNTNEVNRLRENGLITIDHDQYHQLSNTTVLFRAHGEPPEIYQKAIEKNINIIDATCPVVLHIQKKIKTAYEQSQDKNGQIVIFGKPGHPEVVGLIGQTSGKAILISNKDDLEKIDFSRSMVLFSQTTMEPEAYEALQEEIKKKYIGLAGSWEPYLEIHKTVCGQVSNRKSKLKKFCSSYDAVLFVSDKKSSNGAMLFQLCKSVNTRAYFITSEDEIDKAWFKGNEHVGITGATSTPRWLMQKVKDYLDEIFNQ